MSHGEAGSCTQKTGDVYMQEQDVCTRSQALRNVENLGFLRPAPNKLKWYFDIRADGKYLPRVDFVALKKELNSKDLVTKMGEVAHLPVGHADRQKVEDEIYDVIRNHDLK